VSINEESIDDIIKTIPPHSNWNIIVNKNHLLEGE
jgi:hypothetical protein